MKKAWSYGALEGDGEAEALARAMSLAFGTQPEQSRAWMERTGLEHLRVMVAATALPVNADFESGFARTAEGVAESVRMALDTGVADQVADRAADGDDEIERINDALIELDKTDPRLRHVVEMRYFGGLTEQEVAEALGVTDRTVRRDWERARLLLSVWLKR